MQLTLTNFGNTDLTNVNLTSSAPTGWTVRFANETIEVIEAGATVETTAYITPGEKRHVRRLSDHHLRRGQQYLGQRGVSASR